MKVLVVIPARYASTRFPGKPLADIGGQSMIQRVYRQAEKASLVNDVLVATDDERIMEHVLSFNGRVVMTKSDHPSGTDRINEATELIDSDHDLIVNVQGDEPFIDPDQIDALVSSFTDQVDIATMILPSKDETLIQDTNRVKVARAADGRALYFSRAAIPFNRNGKASSQRFLHIGIYAYRRAVLSSLCALAPSALELSESLEQLRWLENGYSIYTVVTDKETIGIDTPNDLERAISFL